MSTSKSDLFFERLISPENGQVNSETIALLYFILLMSIKWSRVVCRIERLARQSMVAWLQQLGRPAANSTSSTAVATKQQGVPTKQRSASTKQRARSTKQQPRSSKQQATPVAPVKPVQAPSPPSEPVQLIIEVLEKVNVDDRKLSTTNLLIRLWLAKALEFPFDSMCICPTLFNCLYTLWPYVMELNANYYPVLCFGVFGVSKATSIYIKLFLLNVIVFFCGVAILEAASFMIFGTALVLLWSWYGVLRVISSIRRLSAVAFIEAYIRTRSELASLRQDHDKCVNELETFRQDKVQRRCNLCYDVDATSIVVDCRHIDLCADCVSKLGESNRALWPEGECPEYEQPCSLRGKEAHVHCLICRGGGTRHKVFFS